jgi:hypothetical protein
MSNLRGVIITKGKVGANVENLDGVSALLTNAPAIAQSGDNLGIALATVKEIKSPNDAENLGINEAYDLANDVRLYRHITEFYRMAGEGTKLYIMLADPTKDMATMLSDHGEALLNGADGEIRYLSVTYNPPSTYAPIYVDGLEEVVGNAIPAAQTLADWAFAHDCPINVFIEGRGINGTAAATQDLREMIVSEVVKEYGYVSVICSQDWNYAETLTGEAQKFADVGTFMGTKAGIKVNDNPGEVGEEGDEDSLDISDPVREIWLTAGLSNHTKIKEIDDTDLQTYNDKGYIFAISYTGFAGYRWNDDHVCAPIIIDADNNQNIHSIAIGATLNKLARLIRKNLLPKVKSTVPVDTETGKLTPGMVKYFEGFANEAFIEMLKAGEISGGGAIVDPNADLKSGDKELPVTFNMVDTATLGQISAKINVKKSLA